jgi:hypothetical protein
LHSVSGHGSAGLNAAAPSTQAPASPTVFSSRASSVICLPSTPRSRGARLAKKSPSLRSVGCTSPLRCEVRERSVSAASSAVLPAARRKARDAGSEPARDGAVAYRKVTVSKMIPAAAATATALLSGRRLSPRLGMVFSASLEFVSQSNPDMAPQLTVRVHGVTHLPKVHFPRTTTPPGCRRVGKCISPLACTHSSSASACRIAPLL